MFRLSDPAHMLNKTKIILLIFTLLRKDKSNTIPRQEALWCVKFCSLSFCAQDLDGSGSLSIEEFMSLPELQQNPLVRWVQTRFSKGCVKFLMRWKFNNFLELFQIKIFWPGPFISVSFFNLFIFFFLPPPNAPPQEGSPKSLSIALQYLQSQKCCPEPPCLKGKKLWKESWHCISCDFRRVIDIFDDDGNGEVDFKEFIMGLSHFRCQVRIMTWQDN